jgi:CheY-like chemotaxis protein
MLNPHYKNMGNLYGSEFWTYLLPPRVGDEGAKAIMRHRLPMTAPEGGQARLLRCLPARPRLCRRCRAAGGRAGGGAGHSPSGLAAKQAKRQADEAAKPLSCLSRRRIDRNAPQFLRLRPLVPCRALSFRLPVGAFLDAASPGPSPRSRLENSRMSPTVLRKLPAILVVDDEVRSQEALRRTLEEDFEVLCASSADEAWKSSKKSSRSQPSALCFAISACRAPPAFSF